MVIVLSEEIPDPADRMKAAGAVKGQCARHLAGSQLYGILCIHPADGQQQLPADSVPLAGRRNRQIFHFHHMGRCPQHHADRQSLSCFLADIKGPALQIPCDHVFLFVAQQQEGKIVPLIG